MAKGKVRAMFVLPPSTHRGLRGATREGHANEKIETTLGGRKSWTKLT